MQVSLSHNLIQNKKTINLNQNPKIKYSSLSQYPKSNVSFGADASLIYLAARGGLEAIKNGPKHYKTTKLLTDLKEVLDNPKALNNLLPDTLSALAKIPDNSSNGASFHILGAFMGKEKWGDLFVGMPELVIKNLRLKAVQTISLASDNSHVNIQSKKDFMRSLFAHGYDLDDDFFKEFKKLNEDYYKNFKEEIVDTCLYSKEYASKRHNACYTWLTPSPVEKNEFRIKNMSLVDSLDEKIHNDYLKKIFNTILETKKYLLNEAAEDFKNDRYTIYAVGSDFYYYGRPINRGLYNKYQYHSIVFDAQLKNCNGDIDQLAKHFKISKEELEKMIISRNKHKEEYKIKPYHPDDK